MALAIKQKKHRLTKPEMFFSLLYGEYMREHPLRSGSKSNGQKRSDKDRQWVYFGSKESMKSVATKSSMFAMLADPSVDTTFYTPNGYYRRDRRWTETLRWLNAFVIDIDNYGESVQEVLERIDRAGLPRPTAIIQTPSGGYHVGFFFTKPVRATEKAIRLYSAIMWHLADDLGADLSAVGANRIFRTPTEKSLVYFSPDDRYSFDVFREWRELNHPYEQDSSFVNVHVEDPMSHPALLYLLDAPCEEGMREKTAFNLALAMKASNWPKDRAIAALGHWFDTCCEKGSRSGKRPFTRRDAEYKARYVYANDRLHAPKAEVIRELTGMPFYYRSRNHWVGAKPRSKRVRSHLHEWEKDLLMLLKSEGQISGTQQEIADRLQADGHTCPLTSLRAVLRKLQAEGKVVVETRRGRGGTTIIRWPEPPQKKPAKANVVIMHRKVERSVLEQPRAVIVHADFVSKQIVSVEHVPSTAADPEPPDPGPPD